MLSGRSLVHPPFYTLICILGDISYLKKKNIKEASLEIAMQAIIPAHAIALPERSYTRRRDSLIPHIQGQSASFGVTR